MAKLLVIGVMDDAHGDIVGNGQVQLTLAEKMSQVMHSFCIQLHLTALFTMQLHVYLHAVCLSVCQHCLL